MRFLLPRLPDGLPPIVVVQHIPANFSRILAEHLNGLCPFTVREAVDGDELRPGLCLLAPGDFHLALVAARSRLPCPVDAVAARASLPSLGRRLISLRGRACRRSGRRCPTHRDGRGWRAWPSVAARSRVANPRGGRGKLRGFRNATSSDQAWCCGGGGNASTDAGSHSSCSRQRPIAMIPEPPIPELGSVTASALAEVLATQFKLSVIASAPDDEPNAEPIGTVPRRHQ